MPKQGSERVVDANDGRDECATRVLGLVTDPDMPTQVGSRLSQQITDWLTRHTGDVWEIDAVSDPVSAGQSGSERILTTIEQYREERGWSLALCMTDLPMLLDDRPLLADVSRERGVGVVSSPGLGGLQPYRRTRQMLLQLLDDMLSPQRNITTGEQASDHRLRSWLTNALGPVRRSQPDAPHVDVRYTASPRRGWVRLVSGMVRANRPWRLVWGLSSALAAALAAAGFGLFTSTVWQLGEAMSLLRGIGATAFALALMTTWLIGSHGLWEKVRPHPERRRLNVLYNASTVATVGLGVACLYAVIYVVGLIAIGFILQPSIVESTISKPVTVAAYLRIAWMVSVMGLVAGAVGSSFASDAAVRQAAYGYREQRRRAEYARESAA